MVRAEANGNHVPEMVIGLEHLIDSLFYLAVDEDEET